jgi:hypothetical protein
LWKIIGFQSLQQSPPLPQTDVLRNILRPYRRSFEGGLKKIPPYGEFWGALFGWLTRRSRRSFGRDSTMVRGWRGTLLLSQYSGIDMCVLEKNAKSLLRLRTVCCFFWDMNHKWMVVFFSKRQKCERKRQTDLTEMSSAGKKCCFVEVFQLFVASYRKKSSVDWEVFVSTKKSLIFESETSSFFSSTFFSTETEAKPNVTHANLESQRNNCFCFLFFPLRSRKNLFLL